MSEYILSKGCRDPVSGSLYSLLAGPHPRSLSLGGAALRRFPPAPRSGRRRFSLANKERLEDAMRQLGGIHA